MTEKGNESVGITSLPMSDVVNYVTTINSLNNTISNLRADIARLMSEKDQIATATEKIKIVKKGSWGEDSVIGYTNMTVELAEVRKQVEKELGDELVKLRIKDANRKQEIAELKAGFELEFASKEREYDTNLANETRRLQNKNTELIADICQMKKDNILAIETVSREKDGIIADLTSQVNDLNLKLSQSGIASDKIKLINEFVGKMDLVVEDLERYSTSRLYRWSNRLFKNNSHYDKINSLENAGYALKAAICKLNETPTPAVFNKYATAKIIDEGPVRFQESCGDRYDMSGYFNNPCTRVRTVKFEV